MDIRLSYSKKKFDYRATLPLFTKVGAKVTWTFQANPRRVPSKRVAWTVQALNNETQQHSRISVFLMFQKLEMFEMFQIVSRASRKGVEWN